MIRILQCVDSMGPGGMQTFIMNVYRNLDRSKIQFDFLLHNKYPNSYDEEINSLGGRIYYIPGRHSGILKNKIALKIFFKNHNDFAAVHLHESSLSYIEPLVAAKKAGIQIRIIHSHSSRILGNKMHIFLHKIHSKSIDKIATNYLSCGKVAGEWMYGQSKVKDTYKIIYNGINIKSFEFNQDVRRQVREELNVFDDSLIVGHVGRFMLVKNHKFLIDIFKTLLEVRPNSYLVLVGDGELQNKIKLYCKLLSIEDHVKFLGVRNDVSKLLQAFDVMVIPSLYEGFPITSIEAQASGLPVYLSNTITDEAAIKDNVHIVNLNASESEWCKEILEDTSRKVDNKILYKLGFDIKDVTNILSIIYEKESI